MNTLLLGVLALCAVLWTAAALFFFIRLHRTFQQTHRLLDHFQLFFLRANRAAGHVEATVHQACDTASDFLDGVGQARQRVASFLVRGKKRKGEGR